MPSIMTIRWEEDAVADLVALRKYIKQENPTASVKVAQRILEKIDLLRTQPFFGNPGRIHNTRELVITDTPYTIIYHVISDTISILRVFHQARQWPLRT